MAGRPSRRQLLRHGAAAVGVGLTGGLAGCSSLRGCTSAEIVLRAELVGNAPDGATVVDAADPRVANSPWVLKVVEAAAEGHPRESSISDCLSDYDALRADLDALPAFDRSEDRLYFVRVNGQVVRLRAVFFAGDDARRSELVLPPAR
ncbi:Tat pathway signal protein [Haloferax sp. Atlit-10N]|uniref:Tat pathway signal protein n=1 Tax=unclassified Haloferax TaxID=2625095 RepID=UPI000E260C71|nr:MULTISPECIES: Tat pathway signal protein [unclassified Haloferax]RDZ44233.1 Tat pathway signal protein [Haloferax sp. Atlit-16N]RDZ58277.1 Tat pathway signal protein [Haloferax sp. Atlit-10N]